MAVAVATGVVAIAAIAAPARAQSVAEMTMQLLADTAVTGYEQRIGDSLLTLLPGATRDRAGNVLVVIGSGDPVRLVTCPIDELGYVVGNIRPDGFLLVKRIGRGAPPLFDQAHEGHRVVVWGADGPVDAVVAIPSTHLMRGRVQDDRPFDADDIVLDLGAESDAEARALGVRILDPVALAKRPYRYGASLLAGPEAARRGACAALAHAVAGQPRAIGTVVAAFVVESRNRHSGLLSLARAHGPFVRSWMLEYDDAPTGDLADRLGVFDHLALDVRYRGTPVETVDVRDLEALAARLATWMVDP